jgi:hypothetical protein
MTPLEKVYSLPILSVKIQSFFAQAAIHKVQDSFPSDLLLLRAGRAEPETRPGWHADYRHNAFHARGCGDNKIDLPFAVRVW